VRVSRTAPGAYQPPHYRLRSRNSAHPHAVAVKRVVIEKSTQRIRRALLTQHAVGCL